jgi:hypothetical protein
MPWFEKENGFINEDNLKQIWFNKFDKKKPFLKSSTTAPSKEKDEL